MEDYLILLQRIVIGDLTIDLQFNSSRPELFYQVNAIILSALRKEFAGVYSLPPKISVTLESPTCSSPPLDSECCSREGHHSHLSNHFLGTLKTANALSEEECIAVLTRLLKNFGEELISGCKTPEKSSICSDEDCCCESG
jgi:hypothetical protein